MNNTIPLKEVKYYRRPKVASKYDADLEPFATLFLKPLTSRKSAFTKSDLEIMCRDPLHSPQLIRYLINFFKQM